jgi:hypothetical protein
VRSPLHQEVAGFLERTEQRLDSHPQLQVMGAHSVEKGGTLGGGRPFERSIENVAQAI